jgi:uncharacterized protein YciI
MHYLLFYEKAPDYAARQGPLHSAHLAHLRAAVRRGEVLLGGSLPDPVDGSAVLLFQADSPGTVAACAAADPFVLHGVVCRWWVREWQMVLGDDATAPLPDPGGDAGRVRHPPGGGQ